MKKQFILVVIFMSFLQIVHGYSASHVKYLQNDRLKSYSIPLKNNYFPEKPQSFFEMRNPFKRKKRKIFEKTTAEKLEILWKDYGVLNYSHKPVADQELLDNLELLKSSTPEKNFINYIAKGLTAFGEKKFSEWIGMPECNLTEIRRKQSNMKILQENNCIKEASDVLKAIKSYERFSFEFFGHEQDLSLQVPSNKIVTIVLDSIGLKNLSWMKTIGDKFDDSIVNPIGAVICGTLFLTFLSHYKDVMKKDVCNYMHESCLYRAFKCKYKKNAEAPPELSENMQKSFDDLWSWNSAKNALYVYVMFMPGLKYAIDHRRNLQEKVMGFAQQIRLSKKLLKNAYDARVEIPGIEEEIELLSGGEKIEDILTERGVGLKLIEKFESLQDALWHSTFDVGEPSYWSSSGHIEMAADCLRDPEVRKLYERSLDMVGEIDCYITLSKKMKENENKPNAQFCFVDFIENSDKPYLKMTGFWNPFIDDTVVVENDIELNGTDGVRTAIITGPNAGGKSGSTKGVMLNMVLASIGIAAAQKCIMTPFRKIITYANIKDNTVKKESLFRAAAKRANTVVKKVIRLQKNSSKEGAEVSDGFCICLMDEPYTGTSQGAAVKAAKKNISDIHESGNCLLIVNTHMLEIIELEKIYANIANYKIDSRINPETGKIELLYKLKKGVSIVSSAEQVIEEVEKELEAAGDDIDDEEDD